MNRTTSWTVSGVALITALIAVQAAPAQTAFQAKALPPMEVLRAAKPFQDNNGLIPPKGVYSGPLFKLNHAWPATLPPLGGAPWQVAIDNGTISVKNAPAYAKALKDAVTKNGRDLIMHYDTWDAAKAGWYNEPWLGSLREAIHGTYEAGQFGPSIFPGTGLRATFQTHVLTYYDARAAYTMHTFLGRFRDEAGSSHRPVAVRGRFDHRQGGRVHVHQPGHAARLVGCAEGRTGMAHL